MNSDQITNFFSGYFHEDWETEAATDADVVALFQRSGIPSHSVAELADGLEATATERESEGSDGWLLSEHGCYYLPSADGLTGSEWLRRLAALLREPPATPDSPSSPPRG